MRKAFFYYSSNIKSLPKGIFFLILLLLLILIPLIISLAIAVGIVALTIGIAKRMLLPGRKKIKTVQEDEVTVIDITPKEL